MNYQIFAWYHSQNQLGKKRYLWEYFWISLLFIAALLLLCLNLGNLPLRDWDEAIVAQVAKEISVAENPWHAWLHPTLWGEKYFNKPPLVHGLIALLYNWTGEINEFNSRFPSALLTAISVPFVYLIGREIFVLPLPALFSGLIYLTLLPVVRHGRLAMLEGALLCFSVVFFWAILRSRRNLRWSLGVGLALSLICLTKGLMMGVLLVIIAGIFLAWDTPRLLVSVYFWLGIILGSLPLLAWYYLQYTYYGQDFITVNLGSQSLARIKTAVEGNSGSLLYYLWELIKYSFPWLIFSLGGWQLAWQNKVWGWSKLILVWSGIYFLAISLMATKLPWYLLLIYPPLALAGGIQLATVVNITNQKKYPVIWQYIFVILTILPIIAAIYLFFGLKNWDLVTIMTLTALSLTMLMTTILLHRRDNQFIPVLFWGMYVALLLFVSSPHWNWELNEYYPVKPVANLIKTEVPSDAQIYINFPWERPSLNFYSQRRVITVPETEQLQKIWQTQSDAAELYVLITTEAKTSAKFPGAKTIDTVALPGFVDWLLIKKEPNE